MVIYLIEIRQYTSPLKSISSATSSSKKRSVTLLKLLQTTKSFTSFRQISSVLCMAMHCNAMILHNQETEIIFKGNFWMQPIPKYKYINCTFTCLSSGASLRECARVQALSVDVLLIYDENFVVGAILHPTQCYLWRWISAQLFRKSKLKHRIYDAS